MKQCIKSRVEKLENKLNINQVSNFDPFDLPEFKVNRRTGKIKQTGEFEPFDISVFKKDA